MIDRPKLLYLGTLPPHTGGSAVVGAQVLQGLAAKGFAVRAIAPITRDHMASGNQFAARTPGLEITRFQVPYYEMDPIRGSLEYRQQQVAKSHAQIKSALSRESPDLILIGRESFIWGIPEIAREQKILFAVISHRTPRNGEEPEYTSQVMAQLRKADLVIAVARHQAAALAGFDVESEVVQNSVDTTCFCPAEKPGDLLDTLKIRRDNVVVLHLSNLKPVKRATDMVESARRALQQNPNLLYVVVGDGECRGALETKCREFGISGHFRFTGWVDHQVIPNYLRLADIVLMPSETEALAQAYLETMACGRHLLASDIPGAREISNHGATAMLFRKGDIDDLTTKTLLAASDPDLRVAIGHRAREYVVRHHRLEDAVASYEATFQDLVRRKVPQDRELRAPDVGTRDS